jgi:hypothetical protein
MFVQGENKKDRTEQMPRGIKAYTLANRAQLPLISLDRVGL